MSSESKSLYEYIRENLADGELPPGFSLPREKSKNQITFADGAQDGIAVYHMGSAEVTEESMEILEELFRAVSEGEFEEGRQKLEEFAKKNTPLGTIDEFQGYITENTDWIDAERLYRFASKCLMSSRADIVKYGMEMLEVFSEPDEEMKEKIRTLGLCDEFTLFALFHMRGWSDANEEIFSVARRVHGWGRIHAVEQLEPETEEIRKWLLEEGISNGVIPDYSALTVYQKADVRKLLAGEAEKKTLRPIAAVIRALLSEGPVHGIRAVEDADAMLLDFIRQAGSGSPDLELCAAVRDIVTAKRSEEVSTAGERYLKSRAVREAAGRWVERGEAVELAKYLGIDCCAPLYRCMAEDLHAHQYQCSELIHSDDYREKTLELFRKSLPMDKMAAEPEDNLGLGKEYENDSVLCYLVQNLADYPLCGTDFVLLSLKSPVTRNRNMALRVLYAWCRAENCTLGELSEELLCEVNALKEKECTESVRKSMAEYGF